MAGRRIFTFGGIAAVGAGTYYLYSAGGDPKLAEKKFEHDAATAARKVKGDFPGRDKEAKKAGEEGYESVRATAQQYADQAKAEAKKAEQRFDAYSADAKKKFEEAKREAEREYQNAGKEVNAAANKFDKVVEEKAAKTQSWLGSWFGGK
ncbi:Nn.00g025730.m01.CDS01 [Neocucurbitaria sp. VM-36]